MRALWFLLLATPAFAGGRHVVQAGETLAHVAEMYGCSLEEIERANGVTTSLVAQGSVVAIPDCSVRSRARRSTPRPSREMSDDDRAAEALATIDGTRVVRESPPPAKLGASLPEGEGYHLRRPSRAFGQMITVTGLQRAIAEVRALYPDVHDLAIGDLSAREGGKLGNHLSHQTGLDVDVGFYFTKLPKGYPDAFAAADAGLDYEATWALLSAFARDPAVEMIFLDRDVTAQLFRWAKQRGTPADQLPTVVKHWPGHRDHLHVRFKQPVR